MTNRRFQPVAWVFVAVVPLAGLQQAVARDCDGNGIPDVCDVDQSDPDGNGNISLDCNVNIIPDECEGAPAIDTFTAAQGDYQLLISDGETANIGADLDGPAIKVPGDSRLNSTKGAEL